MKMFWTKSKEKQIDKYRGRMAKLDRWIMIYQERIILYRKLKKYYKTQVYRLEAEMEGEMGE
jgi:hypothetical protein